METVGVNRVVLLGRVTTYGVSLRQHGSDCASFLLAVPEAGKDGKTYITRIPIETWGKHAQEALALSAGQLVVVESRLRKRKRLDDEWELMVSAFEAVPVGPTAHGGDPRQPSLF